LKIIVQIKDDDSVRGLKVISDAPGILVENGVDRKVAESMREMFGVSGICNIIGAIKMAKHLKLGPEDNVVTIATDGLDRYNSVIENLEVRYLELEDFVLRRWFKDVFRKIGVEDIKDTRREAQKEEFLASQLSPYFENSESEVRIVSAYFVPQTNGVNWLAAMEARGVEVDVVTNSIGSNDVAPVYAHYAKKRKALLRAGVELYELRTDALQSQKAGVYWWQSRSGLHTKAFMIDDRYLFVGSFNMDPRSVNINSEMGIMLDAPSLTERLNKSLDQALPVSTYHLGLDDRGQINWTTRRSDGAISLYKSEPTGTNWQHFWADILGILPIGSQL